jgi:hypothetical protein
MRARCLSGVGVCRPPTVLTGPTAHGGDARAGGARPDGRDGGTGRRSLYIERATRVRVASEESE